MKSDLKYAFIGVGLAIGAFVVLVGTILGLVAVAHLTDPVVRLSPHAVCMQEAQKNCAQLEK